MIAKIYNIPWINIREEFIKDEYECPAGERLIYCFSNEEKGQVIRRYWS